jgi:ATP-dependent DNA helicase RecQ
MILGDAVLRAIAQTAPQNLTALHAVSGMGPAKVDRYGADLIAICRGDAPPVRTEPQRKPAEPVQPRLNLATPQTSAVHPNKRPAPPPPAAELTAEQLALEERLKDWRREAARAAGLPSFFIFSDTVLRNITLAAPTSLETLRNIRGVAPEKLDTFGPAILTLCQA